MEQENSGTEGETQIVRPPATALVIFGASGDLTHRKLIPALYNLACDQYLPEGFCVVGAARSVMSDDEFRAGLLDSVTKHSRRPVDQEVWKKFSQNIFYQPLDGNKKEDFDKLKSRLEKICSARSGTYNYLYYLSVSPSFFGAIAQNLQASGLVENSEEGTRRTSLIVEKPFGHDLTSARELNKILRKNFREDQIFRIDHYLGKETVQNILVFRFANGLFEPLWNQKYIDHIQISMAEDIGVGSRAGYFDQSGIMRDIIQNHLMQILSLLCIEPPISLSDADSIRDEKVKVLRSMRRFTPEAVEKNTVRAQYGAGTVKKEDVKGYMQEDGVAESSTTETFCAIKFEIDNWRWAGVPIYVRAGKRLPKRITEVAVFFKRPPESLFKGKNVSGLEQNVLVIQVQPNEGISLKVNTKPPGPRMRVRSVDMDFTYGQSFGVASADAYERLILDAMRGDATLFTRDDEIEEAWDLLDPVLQTWAKEQKPALVTHPAGTWGPEEADKLLKTTGHSWRQL